MSSWIVRVILFVALIVLIVFGSCIVCPHHDTLPIFSLVPAHVTKEDVNSLGTHLMGAGGTTTELSDRFVYIQNGFRLDMYKSSGGFWGEDTVKLWDPDQQPTLPDTALIKSAAQHFEVGGRALGFATHADSSVATFAFEGFGASYTAHLDAASNVRSTKQLDVQVNFGTTVHDLANGGVPYHVGGGGGEFKVTLGHLGQIIGYSGVWRPIASVLRRDRLVSTALADQRYKDTMRKFTLVSFHHEIVYLASPAPDLQQILYPVYDYSGIANVNGKLVPLAHVLQPATLPAGPAPQHAVASTALQHHRDDNDLPLPGALDPEQPDEGGSATSGTPQREFGLSWLAVDGGLDSSEANVTGLAEQLKADGWTMDFDWKDDDAWYKDWNGDRTRWTDAADLVFYCGHASMEGWTLEDHPTTDQVYPKDLTPQDVQANVSQTSGGMFGKGDLEWLVISACGPLQDETLASGGGDVIDRWKGAFGKLHLLLGFGSTVYDKGMDGRLFAGYALEGKTLVHAWLRATTESQPSRNNDPAPDGPKVWAGAMWPHKVGVTSPYNDHLWGHGNVAPDPVDPDDYNVIWTQP
jgi:hypothetical protein